MATRWARERCVVQKLDQYLDGRELNVYSEYLNVKGSVKIEESPSHRPGRVSKRTKAKRTPHSGEMSAWSLGMVKMKEGKDW